MNTLRRHLIVKVIAWLLSSLSAIALVISALLAIYLADAGAYHRTPVASDVLYYRTNQGQQFIGRQASDFLRVLFACTVFIPAQEEAERTVKESWKREMEQSLQLLVDQQGSNAAWTVLDRSGQVIWSNQIDRPVLLSLTHTVSPHVYDLYFEAFGVDPVAAVQVLPESYNQTYTVRTDLYQLEPADQQQLFWYMSLYRYGEYRDQVAVLPFVFLLLTALAVYVLLWSAGYRKGDDGIHLTWYDRLPLEVLFIAYFLLSVLAFSIYSDFFYLYRQNSLTYTNSFLLTVFGFSAWILSLMGLRLLTSLAVRIKAGQFWRRTLVGQVLRALLGLLTKLPLLWKSLFVMAGLILAELLFIIGFTSHFPNPALLFGFFLFYHGALLCLVCLLVIQLDKLRTAGRHLAAGDLDYQVSEGELVGELRRHGAQLNQIRQGIARAVDERMKSERFKTELITNVSHDIKTPLTSIINYVDLLKTCLIEDPKAREYIDVIDRHSARLKKLAEDVVSASKAAAGTVPINLEQTDLIELLAQTVDEYADRLAQARLTLVSRLPSETCPIVTDGKLLWRVLDNLLQNAVKYGQPDTRVYLDLQQEGGVVTIIIRNISRDPLNIKGEDLFERFVRGDASRSSDGSGLGLAIARCLTELLGGKLELDLDGDLFKAILTVPDGARIASALPSASQLETAHAH